MNILVILNWDEGVAHLILLGIRVYPIQLRLLWWVQPYKQLSVFIIHHTGRMYN
jgi:hypothetical protein